MSKEKTVLSAPTARAFYGYVYFSSFTGRYA